MLRQSHSECHYPCSRCFFLRLMLPNKFYGVLGGTLDYNLSYEWVSQLVGKCISDEHTSLACPPQYLVTYAPGVFAMRLTNPNKLYGMISG